MRTRFAYALSIFMLIFVSSITLQLWVTDKGTVLDQFLWTKATTIVASGHLPPVEDETYGYPATTLLLPAGAIAHTGIPAESAFTDVLMFLMACATASVAVMLYIIRPDTIWWLAGVAMLLCRRLMAEETPPSALITPLLTLLALFILYILRQPDSKRAQYLFAILAGFALATRLDVTTLFLTSAGLFLLPILKKRLIVVVAIAVLVFVALDPYMLSPIQHALHIYEKIHVHFYDMPGQTPLIWLVKIFAIAIFSVFFSFLLFFIAPEKLPVPRSYLLWLFLTTGMITALVTTSHYRPVWYYYPVLLIWEVFCPLFLLSIFKKGPEETHSWTDSPVLKYILVFTPAALQVIAIVAPIQINIP